MTKLRTETLRRDGETTDDLAASIKAFGQLQPVIAAADGTVIVGERRRLLLGDDAEVIFLDDVTDKVQAAEMRISEELSHKPHDPIKRGTAIAELAALLEKRGEDAGDVALARRLGVTRGTITYYRNLAGLPAPVRTLVSEKKLNVASANAIAQTPKLTEKEAVSVARKVVAGTLPSEQETLRRTLADAVRAPARERSSLLTNPSVTAQAVKDKREREAFRERDKAAETADPVFAYFYAMMTRVSIWRRGIELSTENATLVPRRLRPKLRKNLSALCEAIEEFLVTMDESEDVIEKDERPPRLPAELR